MRPYEWEDDQGLPDLTEPWQDQGSKLYSEISKPPFKDCDKSFTQGCPEDMQVSGNCC